LLVTPPNYAFQKFLEHSFPTTTPSASKEEGPKSDGKVAENQEGKLSITNTAIKFVLDQSVGASVNTVVFIAVMGMFKGMNISDILTHVRQVHFSFLARSISMIKLS
jgi:protein Mpv17